MAGTLVKSVTIDIGIKGDTDSKAKLDAINTRAEELKKAFPEYKLKIDSAAATERLAVFRGQVKATADAASKPVDTVILTDKAKAKLLDIQARAEELKARFPEFTVRIDDSAAKRKLAVFAAEAKATTDIVDAEMASAGSGSGRGGLLGKLGGLFGGGGGAASGGGGAASSGGGLLASPAGIGGIAGGALLGIGLIPGAVGAGIGGGVGLGAIAGGLFGAAEGTKIIKADTATIKQITAALKTAVGAQKAQLSAALQDANKQYAKDSAFYAPFMAFKKSLTGLAQVILMPLRGIMGPLSQIFTQFGKGLTLLGPLMTQMFQASLPFIRQFLQVMLQAGKILMPAFTQAMTEMVKSGALKEMTQGLVYLVQGIAGFVVALGPGMKASGQIFERICLVIKGALIGTGKVVSFIANLLEFNFPKAVGRMRHAVSSAFDGLRHDVSSIWDTMWNNTIGRLQRGVADDQRLMNNLRHDIASTFDTIRHNIAAAWDTIWNNTIGRVQRGVGDVTGWFGRLPGRVLGALTGLGHSLSAFASRAMGEMWNGFKGVFSAVEHWFSGLPKMILHALGIHSPPDWAISAGKHIMAGLHIGLGHGLGQLTSFTTGIGAQVAAGLSGALGGGMGDSGARTHSAAVAQAYAASLMSMYGWSQGQMGSLIPLWNQESGWDAWAVNPSSGAYGIPQSLGHGHPFNLGDYKNQIIWGLNYIKQRKGYGSPAAAWAHEQAFNWYGGGLSGGIFNRPTLIGVGERGPERVDVTPVGSGAGGGGSTYYTINVAPAPLARPADIGREVVAAIREHERRAGKSWRT